MVKIKEAVSGNISDRTQAGMPKVLKKKTEPFIKLISSLKSTCTGVAGFEILQFSIFLKNYASWIQ